MTYDHTRKPGNNRFNYSGYKSYEYVKSDRDFTEYDLIEGESIFEPYLVPLTPAQEARVQDLVERILMISLHEHPHLFPARADQIRAYDSEGRVHTAYEALADSNWDCVFDNFLDGAACITSKSGWKWDDIIYDMGMRFCDLAHQDFIIKCERVDDIQRAHREKRIALVAAQEGAAMIENELDRIEILYGIGLRVLGITYSESNALGTGLKETRDGGLTSFGRKAVRRMNEVGLAIDCAHASDQTTLDTVEVSRHPIFLTHTGARGLWNIKRLAPDNVIRAVADKGGVIGIEAAPHTTVSPQHRRHGIESFMDHFEYVRTSSASTTWRSGRTPCTETTSGCTRCTPRRCRSRRRRTRGRVIRPSTFRWTTCAASRTRPRGLRTSRAGWSGRGTATRTSRR